VTLQTCKDHLGKEGVWFVKYASQIAFDPALLPLPIPVYVPKPDALA
jgi:hypothetical protein